MQLFFRISLLAILLVLSGCATRPEIAQGFQEVAAARPGFSTLYIYRPHHDVGRGVWPELFINEQKVVGLKNDGYTVVYVKPGSYRIRTEKNSLFSGMGNIPGEFEIKNEGTYFLKLDRSYRQFMSYSSGYASPSFTTNHERWILVSREAALPEISKCYFVEPYVGTLAR